MRLGAALPLAVVVGCYSPQTFMCGGKQIHGPKQCEATQLYGATCLSLGYTGGTLRCKADCSFDLTACQLCGDQRLQPGEDCDGRELNGKDCQSLGFAGGQLGCDRCRFELTACHRCGDGKTNGAESCDGADLNGLGCGSFGFQHQAGRLGCNDNCSWSFLHCLSQGFSPVSDGTFSMGAPTEQPCREGAGSSTGTAALAETLHKVRLTHAFEIAATEVTQAAFERLMNYNPSTFASADPGCVGNSHCVCDDRICKYCGAVSCDQHPVENLSWHEAAAYCNRLSSEKNLAQCYRCSGSGRKASCVESEAFLGIKIYQCPGYRLPTEAEWEYAFRGGPRAAEYQERISVCSGEDLSAGRVAWYQANAEQRPHPVGQKEANALGLFDMAGNVREWCHDQQVHDLGAAPVNDPWANDPLLPNQPRVVRGGDATAEPAALRAASRGSLGPHFYSSAIGLRCVRRVALQ